MKRLSQFHFAYAISVSIQAAIFLLIVLRIFNLEKIHLAALGSSAFAAFCFPTMKTAQTRHLIGSYFIAILIGMLFSYVGSIGIIDNIHWHEAILGSLSIGLLMVILILLSLEHPPSAGIALSFILSGWDWKTPLYLMAAIIILALIRWIILKWSPIFQHKKAKKFIKKE